MASKETAAKARRLKACSLLNKAKQLQLSVITEKRKNDTGYDSKSDDSLGKVKGRMTEKRPLPTSGNPAKRVAKPRPRAKPKSSAKPPSSKQHKTQKVLSNAKTKSGKKKVIKKLALTLNDSDAEETVTLLRNVDSDVAVGSKLPDRVKKAAAKALADLIDSSGDEDESELTPGQQKSADQCVSESDHSDSEDDLFKTGVNLINANDANSQMTSTPKACKVSKKKVARLLVETLNETGWSSEVENELERLMAITSPKRKLDVADDLLDERHKAKKAKTNNVPVKSKITKKATETSKAEPTKQTKGVSKAAKGSTNKAGVAEETETVASQGTVKAAKSTKSATSTSGRSRASTVKRKSPQKNPLKPKGNKYVGAHVSISGGLEKAVYRSHDIGGRAFAMFLRNQRTWAAKPLADTTAEAFREAMKTHGYASNMVVPHSSYLMNCGSPKAELLQKSRKCLIEDMQRCEKLGLTLYNFHPGSTLGEISVDECCRRIATSINMAHAKTNRVIAVLENMCGQGNTIGGQFTELKSIINLVKNKARVGVCLDTCHAFAAGYNLKLDEEFDRMMKDFDKDIGFKYLKAVHLNDSKGSAGSHLDRHENLGKGRMTLNCFRRLMNDRRFSNIPLVLETPDIGYAKEIRKLYSFVK